LLIFHFSFVLRIPFIRVILSLETPLNVNKKYKDSVFSLLFSEPDLLRELYCALEGVTLSDNTPVTINTLENVLFMGVINDISFEIGGKLIVLIEHQSTINPNMALRLLLYIARVYEGTVKGKALYSDKRLKIPRPEFFVLYNGTAPYPDKDILRLSDLFEKPETLGLPAKLVPALELEVKVININEGRNSEIAGQCKKLAEYSAFIAKVREFERELGDKAEAMKAAIKYCTEHDILKEFLKKHSTEVTNMLITEWSLDEAKEVWFEEGVEKGMEKGVEKGVEKTALNALAKGYSPGQVCDITGLDMEAVMKIQADQQSN
jgi:predicted transposase/invertase (TIGR01784 family)